MDVSGAPLRAKASQASIIWSETARAVIHRKDYLVMLGLARRKSRKQSEPVGPEEEEDDNAALPTAPTHDIPSIEVPATP